VVGLGCSAVVLLQSGPRRRVLALGLIVGIAILPLLVAAAGASLVLALLTAAEAAAAALARRPGGRAILVLARASADPRPTEVMAGGTGKASNIFIFILILMSSSFFLARRWLALCLSKWLSLTRFVNFEVNQHHRERLSHTNTHPLVFFLFQSSCWFWEHADATLAGSDHVNLTFSFRPQHEIYIGNYPIRFGEDDVRALFEEHGISAKSIRMKSDGIKVYSFVEVDSNEEILQAMRAMDAKMIHGRHLRVRSASDRSANKEADERSRANKGQNEKQQVQRRELTVDDVKKHLAFAFNAFLAREVTMDEESLIKKEVKSEGEEAEMKEGEKVEEKQAEEETPEEKEKKEALSKRMSSLQKAQELIKEAFELPEDDSLAVSKGREGH